MHSPDNQALTYQDGLLKARQLIVIALKEGRLRELKVTADGALLLQYIAEQITEEMNDDTWDLERELDSVSL